MDRGAEMRSVEELLGHKSLVTTQISTHVSTAGLREVYERRIRARSRSQAAGCWPPFELLSSPQTAHNSVPQRLTAGQQANSFSNSQNCAFTA